MPAYPTLKEQVTAVLERAGFTSREHHLPVYRSGGTFAVTSGAGVRVVVSWWDATPDQKRELLGRFAAALRDARFVVEDLGDRLYVAEPEERSDEE